jgi:squalene-hopene/tetraprenyl-beta-curcumene cyclase
MLTQLKFKPTETPATLARKEPLLKAAAGADLDSAIQRAEQALLRDQRADGHWVYELEADCTIPAEYILMMHFMDEIDVDLERKIAVHLRNSQAAHGGWPLYHGGDFDLSCTIKCYYALKLAGDDPDLLHMQAARHAILQHGGAAQANVFTRIALALFGQVPWRAVPFIPAEVMLLPKWFPFHINKVSYWSRTVMVPLFVLCTLKPQAVNPQKIHIPELFVVPANEERHYFRPTNLLGKIFIVVDRVGRALEPLIPGVLRTRALKRAEQWFTARLNGEFGIGGIFPAMVNAYEALAVLGYPKDHKYRVETKTAIDKLLVIGDQSAYCQPCVSPVWDTGLACHALFEAAGRQLTPAISSGLDWLKSKQLADEPGDWRDSHPDLQGGGWAFQYDNYFFPDLDDTSMVGWLMCMADPEGQKDSIASAVNWIHGMRSKNGGYASFDADNTYYYLNHIPFADHGALLDPPTEDVTARCIAFMALADRGKYTEALTAAVNYVKLAQEHDGSWFGRWGTNYIYGTWSVLSALQIAGEDMQAPYIRKAVDWLNSIQNNDGGWGESNDTYSAEMRERPAPGSTTFQTAWALLGLLAAGEAQSDTVRRGIAYLRQQQHQDGFWYDDDYTAPGFPRVFYLKYHGYTRYFPLWALAQYRNSTRPCSVG